MAFIGIKLPHETARLLWQLDYGEWGQKEPVDHAHITIMYLGDNVSTKILTKCIQPLLDITEKTTSFAVQTDQISTFPGDKKIPIICPIKSPQLFKLRNNIWESFDKNKISYDKTYTKFKPHVTLEYTEEKSAHGKVKLEFPTITWGVSEITLWGGDSGDERIIMTFPLSVGKNLKKMADIFYGLVV